MGRGRAKAKQTKVARELKYHTMDMDVTALQRELGSGEVEDMPDSAEPEDTDDDPWSRDAADGEDEPARRRG